MRLLRKAEVHLIMHPMPARATAVPHNTQSCSFSDSKLPEKQNMCNLSQRCAWPSRSAG